jgi:iron(III) transport system substrate-binding protein
MRMLRRLFLLVLLTAVALPACRQAQPDDVMLHTGRDKALVGPIVERFAKTTGISVSVQYGEGREMADRIARNSAKTRADVVWTKGAGPLGLLQQGNLLAPLPDSITSRVPEPFRSDEGAWVGLSGRGHVLVRDDSLADTTAVPRSVFALADSSYHGRVGWSPSSDSFQDLVTAMRLIAGADSTREWLKAVYEGGVQVYQPGEIVRKVADGDKTFVLTTHDDFYRTRGEDDSLAARLARFRPGDPGNLIDAASVGILQGSEQKQRARRLVSYLLSEAAQRHFAASAYEYPLAEGVVLPDTMQMAGADRLPELAPDFDLGKLHRSDSSRALLREVGIL